MFGGAPFPAGPPTSGFNRESATFASNIAAPQLSSSPHSWHKMMHKATCSFIFKHLIKKLDTLGVLEHTIP
jgi:hypothetical protein